MSEGAPAGKIRRLSTDLANQIAAGEVVERPASVVKELVENALDARATRVRVEIEQGGLSCLRVIDDGEGMGAEDARLSLERHATSKIAHLDDLQAIDTFGFRGEALPSIASVSRLMLTTRLHGAREGLSLTVQGGGEAKEAPVGCAVGTTIEVKDLFFNVPARRKFLKSTGTESAHVGEVVALAALARPDVTFVLSRDGRNAKEYLRAAGRRERVAQAFDGERLEPCFVNRGPFRIEAHLGAPTRARSGAVALHLFVNGRPVRDRRLARAVAQAYGSVLESGRYPLGAVYIDLPPEMVDVNVHPQKAEVRFADARAVHDTVTRELHLLLAKAYAIPALGPPGRPWLPPATPPFRAASAGGDAPWSGRTSAAPGPLRLVSPPTDAPLFDGVSRPASPASASAGGDEPDAWGLSGALLEASAGASLPIAEKTTLFEKRGFYASLKYLAQVRQTFLLCEGDDGLYVLDQHAAAERVAFDALRRGFDARAVASQRLLLPVLVELLPAEVIALEEHGDDAARLGLDLRAAGTHAAAVHAVPKLLARADPARLVRDLLAEVSRDAGRPFSGAADLVLATMACHGSVRAGDALSPAEARALLDSLDAVDFSGHCPHGRPILMRLSFDDLERRVGR